MSAKLRKVKYIPVILLMESRIMEQYDSPSPSLFQKQMPGDWFCVYGAAISLVSDPNVIPPADGKDTSGAITDSDSKIDNLNFAAIINHFSSVLTGQSVTQPNPYMYTEFAYNGGKTYLLPTPESGCPIVFKLWVVAYYSLNDTDPEEKWVTITSRTPDEIVLNACNQYPTLTPGHFIERAEASVAITPYGIGVGSSYTNETLLEGCTTTIAIWGATEETAKSLVSAVDGRGILTSISIKSGDTGRNIIATPSVYGDILYVDDTALVTFDDPSTQSGYARYYPHVSKLVTVPTMFETPYDISMHGGKTMVATAYLKEVTNVDSSGVPRINAFKIAEGETETIPAVAASTFVMPKKNYIIYSNPGRLPITVSGVFTTTNVADLSGATCAAKVAAGSVVHELSTFWVETELNQDVALGNASVSFSNLGEDSYLVSLGIQISGISSVISGVSSNPVMIPVTIALTVNNVEYTAIVNILVNAGQTLSVASGNMVPLNASSGGVIVSAPFTLSTWLPHPLEVGQDEFSSLYGHNRDEAKASDEYPGVSFKCTRRVSGTNITGQSQLSETYNLAGTPINLLIGNKSIIVSLKSDGRVGGAIVETNIVAHNYTWNGGVGLQIEDKSYFPLNHDNTVGKVVMLKNV